MNTKKIVAMGIALIMTAVMVAGCGNSVDHKDSEVSSTIETTIDKNVEEKSEGKKSETAEKTDATETADKKDSKETSKKTEKPNDNKDADKSDKDKGSVQANSNSSVSKPSNSGNANNNGSASKPNKPSNNSGSSNNGNHNGSVNKPSKPSEPADKPAPHVCHFDIVVSTNAGNCQIASSTVKKCSCGKTTTVNGGLGSHNMVHHDAQGHEVTNYEKHYICNQCGADFGLDADAAGKHTIVTQGCQNYSLKPVPVGSHWEETSPAYDECSICGKR